MNTSNIPESLNEDKNSKESWYYIAVGSTVGMNSKCKGCGYTFVDRNKLRIETKAFTSSNTQKAVFCINSKCVEAAINSLGSEVKWYSYPPYEREVKIPKVLQNSRNLDELFAVSNIKWIL